VSLKRMLPIPAVCKRSSAADVATESCITPLATLKLKQRCFLFRTVFTMSNKAQPWIPPPKAALVVQQLSVPTVSIACLLSLYSLLKFSRF
jgi:hypothetical protein